MNGVLLWGASHVAGGDGRRQDRNGPVARDLSREDEAGEVGKRETSAVQGERSIRSPHASRSSNVDSFTVFSWTVKSNDVAMSATTMHRTHHSNLPKAALGPCDVP